MDGLSKIALFTFGLPGAGKSTLAMTLAQRSNFTYISIGSLLKRLVNEGGVESEVTTARESILSGIDAPISLVSKLVKNQLEGRRLRRIVFDAYPKGATQLAELREMLFDFGFTDENIVGVWLDVSEDTANERLKSRFVCANCGSPCSKSSGFCPSCGGECVNRSNDVQPGLIQARIRQHRSYIPFIEVFARQYELLHISAEQDKEAIFGEVVSWITLLESD